jgi:CBS domain-containing protein
MKARQIMTANPEVITPNEPISRAARIMRDREVGMVPVVTDSSSMELMGIITDRDIAVRHVADLCAEDCSVARHMSRDDITTVNEADDSDAVLAAMRRREVRRVPVTNREGRLVGVIAQADVATSREIPTERVGEVVRAISETREPE